MKITAAHLLEGLNVIQRPLKEVAGVTKAMNKRRCLVIHYTEGGSGLGTIEHWWKKDAYCRRNDIGAHLVIERDGTIYQCRPFNRTISHAGASRWVDPNTGQKYTYGNGWSIGIELANTGDRGGVIKGEEKLSGYAGNTSPLKHRNGGTPRAWEAYSAAQMAALTHVSLALVQRYNLDDITGHDCIAPERKTDPGPAFDECMRQLRKVCGFGYTLPVVHRS